MTLHFGCLHMTIVLGGVTCLVCVQNQIYVDAIKIHVNICWEPSPRKTYPVSVLPRHRRSGSIQLPINGSFSPFLHLATPSARSLLQHISWQYFVVFSIILVLFVSFTQVPTHPPPFPPLLSLLIAGTVQPYPTKTCTPYPPTHLSTSGP